MSHSKEHHTNDKLGFIGLGNMGASMAQNLEKYLHSHSHPALTVYNRTPSKLPPVSSSLQHADSAFNLALQCDIIITSLASDEAVQEVYQELFRGAKEKSEKEGKGTIFVESSTIYPEISGQLEREASKISKTYFLQCPVFGPPPLAKEAKLVWVLSGDFRAKQKVKEYLVPSMGRKFIDVGSNVERASAFKLNGNFLILGIIELLAESMTLADKTGVGSELLMEFIKEFIPAPSFVGYGTKIHNNAFEGNTGFTVTGGLKDASHIRKLAGSVGVNAICPVIDIAHAHLVTSRANGGGDLDWSSLVAGPRLATGLEPFTGRKACPQDTGFGSKTKTGQHSGSGSGKDSKGKSTEGKEEDDGEGEKGGEGHDDPSKMKVGGIKELRNF